MRDSGIRMVVLDEAQREEVRKATQPVFDAWVASMEERGLPGGEVLKAFRANIEKHQSQQGKRLCALMISESGGDAAPPDGVPPPKAGLRSPLGRAMDRVDTRANRPRARRKADRALAVNRCSSPSCSMISVSTICVREGDTEHAKSLIRIPGQKLLRNSFSLPRRLP